MATQSQNLNVMLYGSGARQFRPAVVEAAPDATVFTGNKKDLNAEELARAHILIGWRFPTEIFAAMPRLEWIQSVSVGVEDWIFTPTLPDEVLVTNTKGLYAGPVAEYVIWSLLTLFRRFDLVVDNQRRRRWNQLAGESLAGKTLGIAGLGQIGRAVAKKAVAFDMRVVGIVRDVDKVQPSPDVDDVVSYQDLGKIVGDLDALAVCLPQTSQTSGLVSKDILDSMSSDACVVNISREGVMDYASLRDSLRSGRLSGAALDVFDREPLKPWSRFWATDRLIVTPHISAFTNDYKTAVADLISDNLKRFINGAPLAGRVDRDSGY
jgi:phosphoglycerate dehydrogenase-like enzyme